MSGSKGGMPDMNTMFPARVQTETGAPHFSKIGVERFDADDLSFHGLPPLRSLQVINSIISERTSLIAPTSTATASRRVSSSSPPLDHSPWLARTALVLSARMARLSSMVLSDELARFHLHGLCYGQ